MDMRWEHHSEDSVIPLTTMQSEMLLLCAQGKLRFAVTTAHVKTVVDAGRFTSIPFETPNQFQFLYARLFIGGYGERHLLLPQGHGTYLPIDFHYLNSFDRNQKNQNISDIFREITLDPLCDRIQHLCRLIVIYCYDGATVIALAYHPIIASRNQVEKFWSWFFSRPENGLLRDGFSDQFPMGFSEIHSEAGRNNTIFNVIGDTTPSQMPTDDNRSDLKPSGFFTNSIILDNTLSSLLVDLARLYGVSPESFFISIVFIFVHKYVGENRVDLGFLHDAKNFGSEIHHDRLTSYQANIEAENSVLYLMRELDAALISREKDSQKLDSFAGYVNNDISCYFERSSSRDSYRIPASISDSYENIHRTFDSLGIGASVSFSLILSENSAELSVEYAVARYSVATAASWLKNMQTLINSVLRNPDRAIFDTPVVSPSEYERLAGSIKATGGVDTTKTLINLFEDQVDKAPNNVAVIDQGLAMTYSELDRKANCYAAYFLECGVSRGDVVAVCLDRSAEFLAVIFGVLKAGAAFFPLDSQHPAERLRFMLGDASVRMLITQDSLASLMPQGGWRMIGITFLQAIFSTERSFARPGIDVKGSDLCYVIYTSGSTGLPKGAQLEHQGVINCTVWAKDEFQLTPNDRILLKENNSHDASMWEIFSPLTCGAGVVVVPAGQELDVLAVIEIMREASVTVAYFISSLIEYFLDEPTFRKCETLRHVICGGEPLSPETMRRYFELMRAPLHIRYGQTEASIASVKWSCVPGYMGIPLPLGMPIHNVRVYVVDSHNNLVPAGGVGELVVAGISVGRGYLNRAELTREKFGVDAFHKNLPASSAEARTFRTGDLVRILPTGNICLIGRIDGQVKIRGRRIETGEIQSLLEALPYVSECVVFVQEFGGGERRLVAAIVWASQLDSADNVLSYLRQRLPDYMIPIAMTVSKIPRLVNGKIDRFSLASLAENLVTREDIPQFSPAETSTEKLLEKIWCEITGIERLGVHDPLFDLCVSSIIVMRAVALIRNRFGIRVKPTEIFSAGTVAELAKLIEEVADRQ